MEEMLRELFREMKSELNREFDSKFKMLDSNINKLNSKFDKLDFKMDNVETNVTSFDQRFDILESKMTTGFSGVNERLDRIERSQNEDVLVLLKQVKKNTGDIERDIEYISGKVGKHELEINRLKHQ